MEFRSLYSLLRFIISGVQPKLTEMPFGISVNFNRVSKGFINPLAGVRGRSPCKPLKRLDQSFSA